MLRALSVGLATVLLMTACSSMPFNRNASAPRAEPTAMDSGENAEPLLLPEPGLPLSTDRRFDDVPLPMGVKEDLDRTYVYQTEALNIGRMVYTTKASVNELAQFYLKECPLTGWKLDTVLQADGAELTFEKPGMRLRVSIRDLGLMRRGRMLVLYLTPDRSTQPPS